MIPAHDDHFSGTVSHYQRASYELAQRYITPEMRSGIAIDAGAHIGIFTRRMVNFSYVLAFEPDYDNYVCLQCNTAHLSNVRPVNMALGARDGWGDIRIDSEDNTGARTFVPSESGTIGVVSLDEFTEDATSPISLIKIDTQGAEYDILCGATWVLKSSHPLLIIERPDERIRLMLKDMGYRLAGNANKDHVFVWGKE